MLNCTEAVVSDHTSGRNRGLELFIPRVSFVLVNSLLGQGTIAAISPLFYGRSKLWTLRGKKVFESTDSLEIESDHRDRDLFRTGPQSYRRVAWNRKS